MSRFWFKLFLKVSTLGKIPISPFNIKKEASTGRPLGLPVDASLCVLLLEVSIWGFEEDTILMGIETI